MKYLYKWLQFIKERFNPLSYAVMIFVFLSAHYVLYLSLIKQTNIPILSMQQLIPIILATSLFFFKLRLLDEIKDIKSDSVYHPERPLPRGILSKNEVIRVAFILIIIEIALFSYYGLWAFLSAVITAGYSLTMYKEFFIKRWLRAHLTTYAVTHTFVVILISLTIFVALFNESFTSLPKNLISFSFAGWFLFNIFEFGRKTFAKKEETDGIDSYSKIFGKFGAVTLVIIMAVLSIVFINKATSSVITNTLFLLLIPVVITGLLYVISDRLHFAKIYRATTSLYIIFVYGVVAFLVGIFRIF
ncbi:MAG: hypothetical protein UW07_C0005G0011 [Candidatus Nomurabacteria bacterium GW2011_GWF2_43_8]|uniref:UbiA prenyltransferase n=3 Tax=Candidatus Nomuraibacteriota TaxID=1752729 RepID=A0A0G1FRD4_9BACT|nr:MAG: hypothetical protein UV76_C0006G0010 [Candidatus Nomurabacteria bacterium GW2011_GWA2_43_15]KKT19957.1 MAG: hypothetical protein UW02_C0003G0009 [Candidatus Nomurabacteria bacterium GW2011_GWB1_43_7]KKT24950.1 MAG: hypothetical protein UW07_C0005G0011 [Candidatus Nomurabacteria bacterium GW2011_GWF2_43_8]